MAASREIFGLEECRKLLDSGHYGSVYKTCTDKDCSECFVYKIGRITEHEVSMMTQVFEKTKDTHGHEHVTHLFEVIKSKDNEDIDEYVILMKEIKPFIFRGAPISKLDSLIRDGHFFEDEENDILWRTIMFQIIGTIANIQSMIPNFRHNDLSTVNIMLSNSDEGHECRFISNDGANFVNRPGVHVTIIDFAFSSSSDTRGGQPIHSDIYMLAKTITNIQKKCKPNKLIADWAEFANYVLKDPRKFKSTSEILDHPYFAMFRETSAGGTRRKQRKHRKQTQSRKKHRKVNLA